MYFNTQVWSVISGAATEERLHALARAVRERRATLGLAAGWPGSVVGLLTMQAVFGFMTKLAHSVGGFSLIALAFVGYDTSVGGSNSELQLFWLGALYALVPTALRAKRSAVSLSLRASAISIATPPSSSAALMRRSFPPRRAASPTWTTSSPASARRASPSS